jgi:hypothetical protein
MKHRSSLLLATACALGSSACAPPSMPDAMPDERITDVGAGPAARAPDPLAAFCGAGAAPRTGAIDTQADMVAFMNSLPQPLGLPCLLAALPRPIATVGSNNTISAQPAAGPMNPRLFIRAGGRLILSITLAGMTSTHLETAEAAEVGYSIKGDMAFPRTAAVSERDFYADIVNTRHSGTLCAGCHADEHMVRQAGDMPAFASRALAPTLRQTVPLPAIRALADDCTAEDGILRCQMLRAIFRVPAAVAEMTFLDGTGNWF